MFGKKKKADEEDTPEEKEEEEKEESSGSGNVSIGMVMADLEKLKAKFNTFYELNKASTERFTRINEQIGELRTMLMERDKDSRTLEAKATQAIDMVDSIQPDKLMVEVRKQDAKIEALRGSIESNEAIMKNATNELKQMRNKMTVFSGIEQVMKLNEDTKKELMEIKKLGSTVTRHSDKVETIFTEMQKRFSGFDKFGDNLKDIDKSMKDTVSDLDSLKTRTSNFADKKEMENLLVKFNNFEKQVSGITTLISRKFENLEKDINEKFSKKIEKTEKLLNGFETLAEKTPDLNKYFNLLENVAKSGESEEKVEKIKTPGVEEKEAIPEKKGIFSKLKLKK